MTPSSVPTPASKSTLTPSSSRIGLHTVYYALAAFDVVALGLSVLILVWVTLSFEESVTRNEALARRTQACQRLIRAARAVNLPGNEAFQPGADRRQLELRLGRAEARFYEAVDDLRGLLPDAPAPADRASVRSLEQRLDQIVVGDGPDEPALMAQMVAASRRIFERLGGSPRDEAVAGQAMSDMDAVYAHVVELLLDGMDEILSSQENNLARRLELTRRLRWVEIGFAAVVLMMVGFVTVYGRTLARRMREDHAELARYRDDLERLVDERTDALEASLERLRISDRMASIGTLAAGLGHDMNNVLFPVRCRLDAIEARGPVEPDASELASIRQSIAYLQQLTDGLRLLSIDPDEADSPGTTDLQAWWDDVRPLFLSALPRDATLEGEIPYGIGAVAVAPHRLTQAVFNLVVNAGAAIDPGGTVRVSAGAGDECTVVIEVTDDGHGMPEDVRQQAFDPFFTTKKRGLSTGLGLVLVQGVANSSNGTVAIDSEPGGGTTVTLTLPVVAESDGGAAPSREGATSRARRATVSLADRRVASFIMALLRSSGFDVVASGAGDGAADGATHPDVALWVTDAATATAEALDAYLDAVPGRHVIAVGAGAAVEAEARRGRRVRVVAEAGAMDAMRRAIRDILQQMDHDAGGARS